VSTPPVADESRRPLRVLIADDDEPFRHALAEVINAEPEMEVVAEAVDGEQVVYLTRYLRPDRLDLVLLDIDMPRLDGIRATGQLKATDPTLPIVMLTASMLDEDVFEAMRAGAVGYLTKTLGPEALVRALRDFQCQDALPISGVTAHQVLGYLRHPRDGAVPVQRPDLMSKLSPREFEVLEMVAQGLYDREIAGQLVITERTVKKHVQNILRKLRARNRVEAVARLRESAA
jgi:DNA-binding NarL/FixJ family response regulator